MNTRAVQASIAAVLLSSPAWAAGKTIVILPVKPPVSMLSPYANALTEAVRSNAADYLGPENIKIVSDEKACGDVTCAAQEAQSTHADYFLWGTLAVKEGARVATLHMAETASKMELASVHVDGDSAQDLRRSFQTQASQFFARALGRDAAEGDSAVAKRAGDVGHRAPGDPNMIAAPADVAAPPDDATKLASGLAYKTLTRGTGEKHPGAADVVRVHYTGWTTDGKMFDSSVVRGQPIEFPLDRVIPGWSEAVQQMVVGEKIRTWIPENLAYKGRPGAPQGMLVFDIELLDVKFRPAPPPAPEDVAAPPASAERTASGLASKVLKAGTGTVHPGSSSKVRVHYSGWTTDGKMFDSSVVRGEPAEFPLNRVIAGWTEGVQLMVVGEKRRFWIPEELAYKGSPGAPQGMLVFDVELLEIVKQ